MLSMLIWFLLCMWEIVCSLWLRLVSGLVWLWWLMMCVVIRMFDLICGIGRFCDCYYVVICGVWMLDDF